MKPHTTVMIPARYESTRFPGKILAPILGRPMIQWVYDTAVQAGMDQVIVATDSERIRDCVRSFGGRAEMTRSDHENGSQRIAEVAAKLKTDVVVNLQGDEPALPMEALLEVVRPLWEDPELPMATLAQAIHDCHEVFDPNVVKVVRNAAGDAVYFSRAPIPYLKHPDMEGPHWPEGMPLSHLKHMGIYAYRRETLLHLQAQPSCQLENQEGLEQLRALHLGVRISVVLTACSSVGVDRPEDIRRAEAILRKRGTR